MKMNEKDKIFEEHKDSQTDSDESQSIASTAEHLNRVKHVRNSSKFALNFNNLERQSRLPKIGAANTGLELTDE